MTSPQNPLLLAEQAKDGKNSIPSGDLLNNCTLEEFRDYLIDVNDANKLGYLKRSLKSLILKEEQLFREEGLDIPGGPTMYHTGNPRGGSLQPSISPSAETPTPAMTLSERDRGRSGRKASNAKRKSKKSKKSKRSRPSSVVSSVEISRSKDTSSRSGRKNGPSKRSRKRKREKDYPEDSADVVDITDTSVTHNPSGLPSYGGGIPMQNSSAITSGMTNSNSIIARYAGMTMPSNLLSSINSANGLPSTVTSAIHPTGTSSANPFGFSSNNRSSSSSNHTSNLFKTISSSSAGKVPRKPEFESRDLLNEIDRVTLDTKHMVSSQLPTGFIEVENKSYDELVSEYEKRSKRTRLNSSLQSSSASSSSALKLQRLVPVATKTFAVAAHPHESARERRRRVEALRIFFPETLLREGDSSAIKVEPLDREYDPKKFEAKIAKMSVNELEEYEEILMQELKKEESRNAQYRHYYTIGMEKHRIAGEIESYPGAPVSGSSVALEMDDNVSSNDHNAMDEGPDDVKDGEDEYSSHHSKHEVDSRVRQLANIDEIKAEDLENLDAKQLIKLFQLRYSSLTGSISGEYTEHRKRRKQLNAASDDRGDTTSENIVVPPTPLELARAQLIEIGSLAGLDRHRPFAGSFGGDTGLHGINMDEYKDKTSTEMAEEIAWLIGMKPGESALHELVDSLEHLEGRKNQREKRAALSHARSVNQSELNMEEDEDEFGYPSVLRGESDTTSVDAAEVEMDGDPSNVSGPSSSAQNTSQSATLDSVAKKPSLAERVKMLFAPPHNDGRHYCICNRAYDDSQGEMIACDYCDEWYHLSCVGLISGDINEGQLYKCPACLAMERRDTVDGTVRSMRVASSTTNPSSVLPLSSSVSSPISEENKSSSETDQNQSTRIVRGELISRCAPMTEQQRTKLMDQLKQRYELELLALAMKRELKKTGKSEKVKKGLIETLSKQLSLLQSNSEVQFEQLKSIAQRHAKKLANEHKKRVEYEYKYEKMGAELEKEKQKFNHLKTQAQRYYNAGLARSGNAEQQLNEQTVLWSMEKKNLESKLRNLEEEKGSLSRDLMKLSAENRGLKAKNSSMLAAVNAAAMAKQQQRQSHLRQQYSSLQQREATPPHSHFNDKDMCILKYIREWLAQNEKVDKQFNEFLSQQSKGKESPMHALNSVNNLVQMLNLSSSSRMLYWLDHSSNFDFVIKSSRFPVKMCKLPKEEQLLCRDDDTLPMDIRLNTECCTLQSLIHAFFEEYDSVNAKVLRARIQMSKINLDQTEKFMWENRIKVYEASQEQFKIKMSLYRSEMYQIRLRNLKRCLREMCMQLNNPSSSSNPNNQPGFEILVCSQRIAAANTAEFDPNQYNEDEIDYDLHCRVTQGGLEGTARVGAKILGFAPGKNKPHMEEYIGQVVPLLLNPFVLRIAPRKKISPPSSTLMTGSNGGSGVAAGITGGSGPSAMASFEPSFGGVTSQSGSVGMSHTMNASANNSNSGGHYHQMHHHSAAHSSAPSHHHFPASSDPLSSHLQRNYSSSSDVYHHSQYGVSLDTSSHPPGLSHPTSHSHSSSVVPNSHPPEFSLRSNQFSFGYQ